jgi:hypothetical protein
VVSGFFFFRLIYICENSHEESTFLISHFQFSWTCIFKFKIIPMFLVFFLTKVRNTWGVDRDKNKPTGLSLDFWLNFEFWYCIFFSLWHQNYLYNFHSRFSRTNTQSGSSMHIAKIVPFFFKSIQYLRNVGNYISSKSANLIRNGRYNVQCTRV